MAITKTNNRMIDGSVVNVLDYGVKNDGTEPSGDSNATRIQSAINDASGQVVYFPKGTYSINTALSVSSNVSLHFNDSTIITTLTGVDSSLITVTAQNVVIKDATFNCSSTTGLSKVITASDTASGIEIYNVKVKNLNHSSTDNYIYAIAINIGIDFKVINCEFSDLSVPGNTTEGDLNGSLRGIYVGYSKVGSSSITALGTGIIQNIKGTNLTGYEDTDLIHLISNDTSLKGDFRIKNVSGKNVGKRLVKMQADGCNVDSVYADATNINNSGIDYMFSIVSSYQGNHIVSNVSGKGKFKTAIDCKDSTVINTLNVVSDYASGSIPSGIHTLILCEGNVSSTSTLSNVVIKNVTTSGYWGNLIYQRRNTSTTDIGNTHNLTINNIRTYNSTVNSCIKIEADTQDATMSVLDLSDLVLGTLSNTAYIIKTTSTDSGAVERINLLKVRDITILGSQTMPIACDFRCDKINVNNITDYTDASDIVQAVARNGGVILGVKDLSGSAIAKRLGNIVSSNKTVLDGGYSTDTTTHLWRIDGGDNFIVKNNVTSSVGLVVTSVNSPTNIQQFNNHAFA